MPDTQTPAPETNENEAAAATALAHANTLPRANLAIIGTGPTIKDYRIECEVARVANLEIDKFNETCDADAKKERMRVADQVWGVGRAAQEFPVDLAFHFQHSMISAPRNIAGERVPCFRAKLDMRPVRGEQDPLWCEYPLQDVGTRIGMVYAESSISYALMMAHYLRFANVRLFGIEPEGIDDRACAEFWIGVLTAVGVPVVIPQASPITGARRNRVPYGYEAVPAIGQPTPRFVS